MSSPVFDLFILFRDIWVSCTFASILIHLSSLPSMHSLAHTKYPGAIHHSLLSSPLPVSFPMFTSQFPLFHLSLPEDFTTHCSPPTFSALTCLLRFLPDIVEHHLALYIYLILYIPPINTYFVAAFPAPAQSSDRGCPSYVQGMNVGRE